MREILFRGKRVDNGEWVYGNLVEWLNETKDVSIIAHPFGCCIDEVGNLVLIEEPFVCKVHPETVGQYTGIKDKNGKGIYEGDIIRFIKENCLVIFVENDCAFRIEVDGRISTALRKAHSKDYEVIGNIHDEEEEND